MLSGATLRVVGCHRSDLPTTAMLHPPQSPLTILWSWRNTRVSFDLSSYLRISKARSRTNYATLFMSTSDIGYGSYKQALEVSTI